MLVPAFGRSAGGDGYRFALRGGEEVRGAGFWRTRHFFKQKTAYEILRSDWSSDVCSSD
eukprot:COSAG05_NODE_10810_length_545_cov_0.921525_2_plen_58_part_01